MITVVFELFSKKQWWLGGKLKVPVDQVVDVKVLVVLAKGIDQGLGNVEPAKVEDEL